jgi:drug/metabolite transporter (DMT)-like permease
MTIKKNGRAYFYIILTVLFWGLSFPSTKTALSAMPPMTIGFLRFAVAVVLLAIVKRVMVPNERLERRDIPWAAGAGLTGVTLYFLFENNGIKLISASECSLVIGVLPAITMIAERIAFRTPMSPLKYLGVAMSVAGVWVMVSAGLALSGNLGGYLCMLGAVVSWVVYCFLTRPLFARHSRIAIVFYQSLFGLIGFIPFALSESPQWKPAGPLVWLNVVYLGILCSAAGYYLYAVGLESLGVTICAVFLNLVPVVTVVAGFFLLGERLSLAQLAGGGIVIAGVYLASLARVKKPN